MASFGRLYLRMLQKYTLPTQMATGGVIGLCADSIAQNVIEEKIFNDEDKHDWRRTGRQMAYSGLIFAPVANRAFWVLNKIHVGGIWTTALARTATDMVSFMPFFTILFNAGMGVMEGRSVSEIKQRWQNSFPTIIRNQYMVFAPAQIINMALLPLYARPPFMNLIGLGWTCYLATMNSKSDAPVTDKMLSQLETASMSE